MSDSRASGASLPSDPKAPRRRWIFWLLLGLVLLGTPAALLLMVFGPGPSIRVAKETTHLTTPLLADGYPDYGAALLAAGRVGVTPDNNGAIPFLQAMWPPNPDGWYELSDAEIALVCKTIGAPVPAGGTRLKRLDTPENRLATLRLLRVRLKPDPSNPAKPTAIDPGGFDGALYQPVPLEEFLTGPEEVAVQDGRVEAFIDACWPISRPWTRDELPFVADWVEANAPAFALLEEAARREQWWLPPVELIQFERGKLVEQQLNGSNEMREAARALVTRAGYDGGAGRHTEAAVGLVTLLRLSQHGRARPTLIDQLIATALEGMAHSQIQGLASDPATPPAALRALAEALDALDARSPMAQAIDLGERYWMLDATLDVAVNHNVEAVEMDLRPLDLMVYVSCDWNIVLSDMNAWCDRCLAALQNPSWTQREGELVAMEAALNALPVAPSNFREALHIAVSQERRGELASAVMRNLLLPPLGAVARTTDRIESNRQLTRVAIDLALYRAAKGAYPENLTPEVYPTSPVDLLQQFPLVYKPLEEGYLLYTVGANGNDEGGSREEGEWGASCYEGRELTSDTDLLHKKIPTGADDLSVRTPWQVPPGPWEALSP
ncbi:hypothetical protein [Botrimarina hoheduenensis]|uniref:Bacterial type II secretion system protein G n=1 Tax=Botrimarina hoheduenensis TaxID=2528000 RepID=A0A5C5W7W0_9BACT|nr:hypothetical protein [Botrimarina hoheduenensis]TWT46664.1 hypothetical protein Pla111_17650 [Botrimarina hoheduenensis]